MSLQERIRNALKRKPYWSSARVAEYIGSTPKAVSVTASRHGIKFMTRREVEDYFDGKPVKASGMRKNNIPGPTQSQ